MDNGIELVYLIFNTVLGIWVAYTVWCGDVEVPTSLLEGGATPSSAVTDHHAVGVEVPNPQVSIQQETQVIRSIDQPMEGNKSNTVLSRISHENYFKLNRMLNLLNDNPFLLIKLCSYTERVPPEMMDLFVHSDYYIIPYLGPLTLTLNYFSKLRAYPNSTAHKHLKSLHAMDSCGEREALRLYHVILPKMEEDMKKSLKRYNDKIAGGISISEGGQKIYRIATYWLHCNNPITKVKLFHHLNYVMNPRAYYPGFPLHGVHDDFSDFVLSENMTHIMIKYGIT